MLLFPTIERDLDASSGQLQWIVDSYTLVFAGLLLTMGALGDRFSRRGALAAGLAIFGGASLASAFAESANMLIVTRALMGIGGALIMPTTLSIITNVFPAEERAKAIGIWAAVAGIGVGIGPASGGWLLEQFDWTAVFLINVPIVAAALLAIPKLVPDSKDPEQSRLDPIGAVLSTVGLGILTAAIIQAPDWGWTSGRILGGFAASAVVLAGFVIWELRSSSPMLDVRMFRIRRFTGASVSIALVFFALFGAIYFLTQYLQGVLDYTPFEAGVRMLPVAGGLILGGPLSAKLAERFGTRSVVAVGLGIVAVALFMLAGAETDSGYSLVACVARHARLRHGRDDGAGHRVDHELGSAEPRGRRLGDERHGPAGRRHARRGDPRKPPVEQLRCRHGARGEVAARRRPRMRRRTRSATPAWWRTRSGGDAGRALSNAAETAFTTAMSSTLTVAAATALAGAIIALVVLPGQQPRAGREARIRDAAGAGGRVSDAIPAKQDDRAGAEEAPARGRGRPRSVEADQAILDATLRMLGTHGVAGTTIEGVAADAGVGKTTIYRRWPTKTDLIRAAISDIVPRGDPPDTGTHGGRHGGPRGDATAAARRLEAGGHRPALAGRVDERPGAAPGLRRQGGHPFRDIAPVVHRAGDRARRAAAGSRGGGARGPPALDTRSTRSSCRAATRPRSSRCPGHTCRCWPRNPQ